MVASKTVRLEQQDRIFAKLVELGVNEKWLMKANPTREEANQLLKGLLCLRDLYPNTFKDK
jgi:hypothetical protein